MTEKNNIPKIHTTQTVWKTGDSLHIEKNISISSPGLGFTIAGIITTFLGIIFIIISVIVKILTENQSNDVHFIWLVMFFIGCFLTFIGIFMFMIGAIRKRNSENDLVE